MPEHSTDAGDIIGSIDPLGGDPAKWARRDPVERVVEHVVGT